MQPKDTDKHPQTFKSSLTMGFSMEIFQMRSKMGIFILCINKHASL